MTDIIDTLVVVLAHSLNEKEDGSLEPSDKGKLRAKKAFELLRSNPDYRLCVSGGYNPDFERSGAATIWHYMCEQLGYHPRLGDIVTCNSTNTVGNMTDLVVQMNEVGYEKTVHKMLFVVHLDQARQAVIPTRLLLPNVKTGCVESGEKHPYPKWARELLIWVTKHDPYWKKLWSLPFRFMTVVRRFTMRPR